MQRRVATYKILIPLFWESLKRICFLSPNSTPFDKSPDSCVILRALGMTGESHANVFQQFINQIYKITYSRRPTAFLNSGQISQETWNAACMWERVVILCMLKLFNCYILLHTCLSQLTNSCYYIPRQKTFIRFRWPAILGVNLCAVKKREG